MTLPNPIDGRTRMEADKDRFKEGDVATRGEMMTFLAALAQGIEPFTAARTAGRPLSFWRGLAKKNRAFGMAYEQALIDYGHAKAAESVEIADKVDGRSSAQVSKAKLRVDTRMKMAKAFAPERFGDKVDLTKRTIDVRRTEFVSYFGVRVMKQDEPSDEELEVALEGVSSREPTDDEGPAALGPGSPGAGPDEGRVPAHEEGLPADDAEPEGGVPEGDR